MPDARNTIALPAPFVAPEAFLVTVHVGLVPETDHAQVGWKVEDPIAEQLLGMGSCPHAVLARIHDVSRGLLTEVLDACFVLVEPF